MKARIQTAFRLKPELLSRLKRQAEKQNKSLNAYVEDILERKTRVEWPKLPKDYTASPEDLFSFKGQIPSPTEEMLKIDPKLAYLWSKGA
jgi:hypothetical protein